MDYVCLVAGKFEIPELKIKLGYMEIINLNPEDFKSYPSLRDAERTLKIEKYDPRKHRNAKRAQYRVAKSSAPVAAMPQAASSQKDIDKIQSNLNDLYKKMDSLVSRMDVLITKISSKNQLNDASAQKTDKFPHFFKRFEEFFKQMEEKNKNNEDNFNKLISKIDQLISKGIVVSGNNPAQIKGKEKIEDTPDFIPDINIGEVKGNILTKEVKSKGTSDILEKLKNMK